MADQSQSGRSRQLEWLQLLQGYSQGLRLTKTLEKGSATGKTGDTILIENLKMEESLWHN